MGWHISCSRASHGNAGGDGASAVCGDRDASLLAVLPAMDLLPDGRLRWRRSRPARDDLDRALLTTVSSRTAAQPARRRAFSGRGRPRIFCYPHPIVAITCQTSASHRAHLGSAPVSIKDAATAAGNRRAQSARRGYGRRREAGWREHRRPRRPASPSRRLGSGAQGSRP